MFDKLKEKIENLFLDEQAINVFSFGDAIAEKIDWKPLENGGSSHRTQKVRALGNSRIEVIATLETILLCTVFILVGIVMSGLWVYAAFMENQFANFDWHWVFALIGLVFFSVGLLFIVKMSRIKVFDKQIGYYWVGKKGPWQTYDFKKEERFVELRMIHAIQLVRHLVKSDDSSFYSYELNLVLKDLRRINVMDHSKLNKLREDADTLAAFLNVPIWDVVP